MNRVFLISAGPSFVLLAKLCRKLWSMGPAREMGTAVRKQEWGPPGNRHRPGNVHHRSGNRNGPVRKQAPPPRKSRLGGYAGICGGIFRSSSSLPALPSSGKSAGSFVKSLWRDRGNLRHRELLKDNQRQLLASSQWLTVFSGKRNLFLPFGYCIYTAIL